MKVPQLPGLAAVALLCAAPADAAAARCRLPTPSSTSSASSASPSPSAPPAPVQPPICGHNYLSNNLFSGSSGWTFGGDAASQNTGCGVYTTCAQLTADQGAASVSQTFAIVPGYSYLVNIPAMYSIQPATAADVVTCEIVSGAASLSIPLTFYYLYQYYGTGPAFTPQASTATLTCTLTSASTGTVHLSGLAVYWADQSCSG
ncbi:hypothetical protein SCUCBS95973_009894 [Sporothrix curviconia]|uniref:Ig-like domain-containing protein n=1 Tax=Sporothrix curviconia TaxID=1260050 RepID=A0ABP0D175_9PEZI